MWFDPSFQLIIKRYTVYHLKDNLKSISIHQFARLYTIHLQSYGCLNDEVQIIASKIDRSYLKR